MPGCEMLLADVDCGPAQFMAFIACFRADIVHAGMEEPKRVRG